MLIGQFVERKFQFIDRVSVMDERGRCREYTTADLARFLLRGLEKAQGEWAMVCTAHNLRKLAQVST